MGRRAIMWSPDAFLIAGNVTAVKWKMINDDLVSGATRTHDDLLAIAKMFAEAEHYMTAIHIRGFATRILHEAVALTDNENVVCSGQ